MSGLVEHVVRSAWRDVVRVIVEAMEDLPEDVWEVAAEAMHRSYYGSRAAWPPYYDAARWRDAARAGVRALVEEAKR